MPLRNLQYPKHPYNTVKRYKDRADYSLSTIHSIFNTSPLLHISFVDPNSDVPFPSSLPMIGRLGSFTNPSADLGEVLDLYLHAYVSSRLVNLVREASNSPESKGFPVTVSTAHVDGIVLALTPNAHSYNYRSATVFGYATLVTDVEEKLYAMQLITDGVVPGRWENTRVPPNKGEMASTAVVRVKIVSGSGKVRSGGCHDDRGDLESEEVTGRVWAGVVPVWTMYGEPVPAGYNRVAEVPAYLEEWRKEGNRGREELAKEAMKE